MPHPKHSGNSSWDRIAQSGAFRKLLRAKARFLVPAVIFFFVYYFALLVLVGYFPAAMSRPILGPLNGAYLFALSQFPMAWIVAAFYMRAAARFDRQAEDAVAKERASS